jgi:hypothetical protein
LTNGLANLLQSKITMTINSTPSVAQPSAPVSTPLTAASLAAHQRAMAANPSISTSQGGWVCGGLMYHQPATPDQKRWNELTNEDPLAADIEENLRVVSKARKDKGN